MNNSIFPWQSNDWRQLRQLSARLPHAILFHGAEGIGKTAFAEHFAQSLLCDAPTADGHSCGHCASCGWFAQSNHPDYRRLRPEALEAADPDDAEATDDDGKKAAKASKAPSKDIRIDQVRALADFMNISTHRRGVRVVLLYPAEALNAPAANALLKTLEEPPPGTVFLLVTHNPDRLLPTILSRCRKFALSLPSRQEALAWLQQQGVAEAEAWLAEQGGAPLAAQALAASGQHEAMHEFLQQLARPGIDSALKTAEKLQKTPLADQVAWLQRWLYDLFSMQLAGTIRYYPRYRQELAALGARIDGGALLRLLKNMNQRGAIAGHPLSARLFIEDMLLDYAMLFPEGR